MSVRLYVGNLPEDVDRQGLETAFAEAGSAVSLKLITDRKTNQCRGFGFVTVKTDEEANQFIEKFNGQAVNEITLKIEKALPREKSDSDAGASKRGKGRKNPAAANKATHVDIAAFQPDPRWASALEQLKERLAETANS